MNFVIAGKNNNGRKRKSDKKRKGGAEKLRDEKRKILKSSAAGCSKLSDIFLVHTQEEVMNKKLPERNEDDESGIEKEKVTSVELKAIVDANYQGKGEKLIQHTPEKLDLSTAEGSKDENRIAKEKQNDFHGDFVSQTKSLADAYNQGKSDESIQ